MAYDFWGSNFGGKQDKNTGKVVTTTPSKPSTTAKALSTALSKSGGSGGKSSSPTYSEHVSWFGSPEKYASAIQRAKSSGKALSDPNAAAAFERDNPQLFGGVVPGGGSTPAPSYSSGAASGGGVATGGTGNNANALITALKNIGSQFGSTPASGQTALNTQANEARNAFIQAGGNFQDIPTNLWGSDPSQGFQTGQGAFMGAPSYGATNAVGGMPVANAGLAQGPAAIISGIGAGNLQDINRLYGQNTGGQWWNTAETAAEAEDWINMVGPDAWKVMGSPNVSPEAFGSTALWAMTGGKDNPPVPDEVLNRITTGLNTGTLSPAAESLKKALESYMPVKTPIEQQPEYLMQQVQPLFNQYQSEIENMDAETARILQNSLNQTMDMINSTESSLMQRLEEMGQGIDPATQAALASLKETVGQQREYLKEEMGARNLLQSGIYLKEMDERINRGELSETQQLLGKRLSDIQNQINNAILSFGNARIQASSSYGLEASRLAESTAQRKQQATTNLTNAMMKALELSQQQQSDAANLDWEKEKSMLPYQYVNATTQYTHDTPSAGDLLTQSRFETEWPWKEKQYQYELGKPYYKPSSGGAKTSDADTKRDNLAKAQSSIWNKLDQGKSIQEVEAAIVANAGEYTSQGLNINDLIDYAWYSSTGATKPKQEDNSQAAWMAAMIQALKK